MALFLTFIYFLMTTNAKLSLGALIVAAAGIGLYFYLNRPVESTPGQVQTDVTHLETTSPDSKQLHIVSKESTVEFKLDEDLRGTRITVVGTTNEIAGDIAVQVNPGKVEIGEIKIDARTLKTDSEQRNGAIARFILKSEDPANQYIVFKPTVVEGVPATITPDQEFTAKITGDLTIRGVTKPVTFDGKGTYKADGSFVGTASTVVVYGDFGAVVPDLPFLANVEKSTTLTVNIVAR